MTEEKQMLLAIKGLLSEGPEEERVEFENCANRIRAIVSEFSETGEAALLFLSLEAEVERQEGRDVEDARS